MERDARGRERETEIPLKIGSNKLSTIFAGLNTLKRLEIRPPGGPFVRRVAGERHEGLRRVIHAAKREAPGTQKGDEESTGEDPRYYSCHRWLAYTLARVLARTLSTPPPQWPSSARLLTHRSTRRVYRP